MAKKESRKRKFQRKALSGFKDAKKKRMASTPTQISEVEKKDYEKGLQRRLRILKQYLEEGRIKFVEGLTVIESLKSVRYAPDGSADLSTVDASVRALAGAITVSHERDEIKKAISLLEIQNIYFNFLEKNFGFFHKIMLERGLTPHQAGLAASKQSSTIAEITKPLPDFLKTIEEFWGRTERLLTFTSKTCMTR